VCALIVLGAAAPAAVAAAQERPARGETAALQEKIDELERQIRALRGELERLRAGVGAGVAAASVQELERRIEALSKDLERLRVGQAAEEPQADRSEYGFGPAASKVYRARRGLSVGGYGEMLYQNFSPRRDDGGDSGRTDNADFLRAVLYFGYKFSDRVVFNSEIEYEHATTGSGDEEQGEVSVEFASLDFFIHKTFNVRAGLLLAPLGFINELHEPPIFHGARRPEVETQILPTTWRDNGAGVFGEFGPWSYRAYVMAPLDGTRLAAGNLREGRQSGSRSNFEDAAFAARVDLTGVPGVLAGASVYTGESGLDTFDGGRVTLADVHAEWRWKGLELRALAVQGIVSDVETVNAEHLDEDGNPDPLAGDDSVGERLRGWYAQIAYDVLSPLQGTEHQLFPFARYERLDTQRRVPSGFSDDPATDGEIRTFGLTYKPIPNVAIKADYQDFDNEADTGIDQFNLAVSYLF
jgi:uncharacterized small protein (DUF1192 family)